MKIEDLKNKKIAILGFGREGKSTLSFLEKNGINDITILDKSLEKIDLKYKIITGENYLDNLSDFDVIIKSPGISPYTEKLINFRHKITTQIELFFSNYTGKVIGISGTKGKSTTSTFLYEVLKNAGYNVVLVGNIGKPVLDEIDINNKYDYIVYEMSSYMLDGFIPKLYISILLNIFREHLDWHKTEKNYINAKLNITKNCKYSLINSKIGQKGDYSFGESGNYIYINDKFYIGNTQIVSKNESSIKADHFLENFSGVLGCIDLISKDEKRDLISYFNQTLSIFSPLPHRLQVLGTFKGITFIDDAISTTPESTIEAIKSNFENTETIFLGGTDRGYDFASLVSFLNISNIKNIVLFPETGDKIFDLLGENFNLLKTSSMEMAVKFAYDNTSIGKTTLLSTASPSYILWKNYEEKGDEFKKYVLKYNV